MTLIPAKTPLLVKKMFPNYIWNIPTIEKVLYITFDDGPTPDITDWTLNILKQYHAKATFFCIGNNVEKHPEIFHNIINQGHTIGNHTHNHLKGWKTKTKAYLENIEACEIAFKFQFCNAEGSPSTKMANNQSLISNLFRPPYGQIKSKQGKALKALGYDIIMWDVLSFDWDKSVPKKKCVKHVIDNAKEGSVIVFHDSEKAAKNMQYALPIVLEHFSNLGYLFKALSPN